MENRCRFWLPKKKRFCANAPLSASQFCGNHKPETELLRIPCPVDPSHSILQENLDVHVKRCPLLKQVQALQMQPFFKRGVNGGEDDDCATSCIDTEAGAYKDVEDPVSSKSSQAKFSSTRRCSESSDISSDMKRARIYKMSVPEFSELLKKIKSIHSSLFPNIQDSYVMPQACDKWLKKQVDRQLPFHEKHVLQQASILGNLEKFGVLKRPMTLNDPDVEEHLCRDDPSKDENGTPAVVEFGAGRGYLTHMLTDCYGIRKVYLIERKSYKLKADRSLRQKQEMILERLRIDNKKFLSDIGITKEDFNAITWFTSWAVDADHGSHLSDAVNQGLHLHNIENGDSDAVASGVEEVVRKMKAVDRAVLGLICKDIIDIGRFTWIKEHQGLEAHLVKYVPSSISPENHLLIAKSRCHL